VQPQAAQPQPVEPTPAPTQPPTDEELPDHLNFTANLDLRGLRADGDSTGEQNVGPTK